MYLISGCWQCFPVEVAGFAPLDEEVAEAANAAPICCIWTALVVGITFVA